VVHLWLGLFFQRSSALISGKKLTVGFAMLWVRQLFLFFVCIYIM